MYKHLNSKAKAAIDTTQDPPQFSSDYTFNLRFPE